MALSPTIAAADYAIDVGITPTRGKLGVAVARFDCWHLIPTSATKDAHTFKVTMPTDPGSISLHQFEFGVTRKFLACILTLMILSRGAIKQRIHSSHLPLCHRHMVIATNFSSLFYLRLCSTPQRRAECCLGLTAVNGY